MKMIFFAFMVTSSVTWASSSLALLNYRIVDGSQFVLATPAELNYIQFGQIVSPANLKNSLPYCTCSDASYPASGQADLVFGTDLHYGATTYRARLSFMDGSQPKFIDCSSSSQPMSLVDVEEALQGMVVFTEMHFTSESASLR